MQRQINFFTLFACVSTELCLIQGSVQFRGAASFLHVSSCTTRLKFELDQNAGESKPRWTGAGFELHVLGDAHSDAVSECA